MKLRIKFLVLIVFSIFLAACHSEDSSLPGYIEGEYTYIASGVSGTLFKIFVKRSQSVKQNDILYQLDLQPEAASVAVAKANIESLQPQVEFAKIEWQRQIDLYKKKFTSKQSVDQTRSEYESKLAQLLSNESRLIESQWALQQKTSYAPVTGVVFDVFFRLGEKIKENQPVLALLAPENIMVLFYIPESLLKKIKLGQVISFTCDNCNGKTTATINYISPEAEYTPPIIYSKDTRYKLVYLVRATIPKEKVNQFHPGQPISVYLQP